MVMMVAGEVLGELVARELGVGDDAVHDTRVLEELQVPVRAALGEAGVGVEDLGKGERPTGRGEHIDQRVASGCRALPGAPQPGRDGVVERVERRHGAQVYESVARDPASGYGPRGRWERRPMDITERFAAVVQRPDDDIALDEAALLIAAHDHPVDVDAQVRALDALAHEIGAVDAPALAHELFVARGFAGNTVDYGDPRNSYLDVVLDRRLGLPITLSVLMIEVGRRLGLELFGVGMPGHFLVGASGSYVDPFHRGAFLTADEARELYERTQPGAAFTDAYLAPVGPRAVLARMLANLVHSFGTRTPLAAVWALKLRLAIPDLPARERDDGERLLARLKAYSN